MKTKTQCVCLFLILLLLTPLHKVKAECNSVINDKLYIYHCELNFNRCTKDAIPTIWMRVSGWNDWGDIKVSIRSNIPWLIVKQTLDESDEKEFDFSVDASKLSLGLYKEEIVVETDRGNHIIPVRLDLVEKTVKLQYTAKSLVALVDGKEVLLKEVPFVYKDQPWIPLRLTVESFGGTIDFETDNAKRIVAFTIHYKDIQERLIVCDGVTLRNNQAFVRFGWICYIFGCKGWYELSENVTTLEY